MKFITINCAVFIIPLVVQICNSQTHTGYQTPVYSAKESFPKDFPASSNKRATINLQSRVSSMEHSINGIYREVQTLKSKTKEMKSSLSEQKTLLKKLDEGFLDMERVLSTHTDVLDEMMDQIGPNDRAFAISNQTCGEVLFARSGTIIYSKLETDFEPLKCVWTIQAGHFSQIKIKLHDLKLPAHWKAYAVELVRSGNERNSLQTTRATLLSSTIPQIIMEGPFAFIVLTRNGSSTDATWDKNIRLFLEFEGRGTLREKRTQFFHRHLLANNGNGSFSERDLETWRDGGLESYFNDDGNYGYNFTRNFGTVVLSNLTTKTKFKLELDRGRGCKNDSFFILIPDLLQNGTSLIDLCKIKSSKFEDDFTIYGTPVAFLIGRSSDPSRKDNHFSVGWQAETPYPSSYYGPMPGQKCGGILGGTGGKLYYRAETFNESLRCVWVIRAQPEVRSHIAIRNVRFSEGISAELTSLSLVGLTDSEGNALDPPYKLNLLLWGLSAATGWRTYGITGREMYIVFSSDPSSARLRSFSLEWAAHGVVKTGRDMSPGYTLLHDNSGSLTSSFLGQGETSFPQPYHVFILLRPPKTSSLSSILPEMKLALIQTSPIVSPDDKNEGECIDKSAAVFTLLEGAFQRSFNISNTCKSPGNVEIEETNGIAVILMKLDNQTNSNVTLDYEWKQGPIRTDDCGGVVAETSGVLNYKPRRRYEGNERCIWLIHTPNCSSISLTLLRNGFYGARYLVANTIDQETGRLRNDSVLLNTRTPRQTISEEFFILLFQTINGTTSGTGFSLQYNGIQCRNEKNENGHHPIHYHLQHFGPSHLNFSFKKDDKGGPQDFEGSDLYVIAYSEQVSSYKDVYTKSTIIDLNRGVFYRNNDDSCTFDSIRFYGGNEKRDPSFHDVGHIWEERFTFPEMSRYESSTCPRRLEVVKHTNAFRSEFLAFLAIYKVGSVSGEIEFVRRTNDSQGLRWSPTRSIGSTTSITRVSNSEESSDSSADSSEERDDDWFVD